MTPHPDSALPNDPAGLVALVAALRGELAEERAARRPAEDGTLRLWDAGSGQEIAALRGHRDGVWACAFSPDGRRLASCGTDGTLRLWDAGSAQEIAALRGHEGWVQACAFSPDGWLPAALTARCACGMQRAAPN